MAYFVGRDVDIAITTEHPTQGIIVREPDATIPTDLVDRHIAMVVDFDGTASTGDYVNSTDYAYLFAGPRAMSTGAGCNANGAFGELDGLLDDSQAWNNQPDNLTGLELSLGVMDEDVAFIGQRNIMKAEIKKDNSVTLTRKKADKVWDGIYNDARFGIKNGNTVALPTNDEPFPDLFNGLSAPDFVTCGYRVVLRTSEKVPVLACAANNSGAIGAGDVSITVADGTSIPDDTYIKIDQEIMLVTNVATHILTVVRAQLGTEASSHNTDQSVYNLGTGGEGEVIVLRNCYITDHAVTLSADGSQEETISLQSYTDPKIYDGITGGQWDDATTSAEL